MVLARVARSALVEQMQLFTGLEADGLAGGDGDFCSGAGITSDAGFSRLDGEDAEAAKLDAITGNERLLHAVEDGVNGCLCFGSGQSGTFYNPLYQILLNHLGRRPWAVFLLV